MAEPRDGVPRDEAPRDGGPRAGVPRVLVVGSGPVADAVARGWLEDAAMVAVAAEGGIAGRPLGLAGDAAHAPVGPVGGTARVGPAIVVLPGLVGGGFDAEGFVRGAVDRLGGLDIVVGIAGPTVVSPFLERTAAPWSDGLEASVGRTVRLARAAARALMDDGGGSIVFVGSLDAFHAYAGRSQASVAMGALLGLVRSLAVELAPVGVRTNAVLAGPLGDDEGRAPDGTDPELLRRTLLRSPRGRLVTPAEVAAAVRFVAGPGAGFMSGQTLRVDGGWASLNQAPDGMRFP